MNYKLRWTELEHPWLQGHIPFGDIAEIINSSSDLIEKYKSEDFRHVWVKWVEEPYWEECKSTDKGAFKLTIHVHESDEYNFPNSRGCFETKSKE